MLSKQTATSHHHHPPLQSTGIFEVNMKERDIIKKAQMIWEEIPQQHKQNSSSLEDEEGGQDLGKITLIGVGS